MFTKYSVTALALALLRLANADGTQVGAVGTLSSMDGGLQGKVAVTDSSTISITGFTIDASAPALYLWGTTTPHIQDGFRINNERIGDSVKNGQMDFKLDAGKTLADFSTVGIYCEQLKQNFGQATLTGGSGGSATSNSSSPSASSTSGGSSAATSSSSSSNGVTTVTVFSLPIAMSLLATAAVFASGLA